MSYTTRLTKFLPALFAAVALSLMLPSCSKDDDDDNGSNGDPQPNELSVNIDGDDWNGNIGSVASSGGTRQVNATRSSDTSHIQLYFPEDTTGSFTLSNTSEVSVVYMKDGVSWIDNLSGTLTLVENNSEEISGTFSATLATWSAGSDTLNLTDGEFYWSP